MEKANGPTNRRPAIQEVLRIRTNLSMVFSAVSTLWAHMTILAKRP